MDHKDESKIVWFERPAEQTKEFRPIPIFDHDLLSVDLVPGLIIRARADYKDVFRKGMIGVCAGIVYETGDEQDIERYYFAFENHQVEDFPGWLVEMFLEHLPGARTFRPAAEYRFACRSMLQADVQRGLFDGAFARPRAVDVRPELRVIP